MLNEYKEYNINIHAKQINYYEDFNGCWICTSHIKDKDGYYKIRRNNRYYRLHRYIYMLENGVIPSGMVVRHKCDKPSCINPNHLEIGTVKDNTMDRVTRGRGASGSKNGGHKLNEEQVAIIRNDTRTCREIAKEYGISFSTVSLIKRGATWKFNTFD